MKSSSSRPLDFLRRWFHESPVFSFNQVERDLWVKRQAASIPPSSSVLDVGAGSCPYRELFAHCTYKTQDFQGLGSGQLRGPTGYGKIDYVCDAAAIPVPDQSFDAVLCTEVLEHVPEPIKVIGEIGRILKPGGVALLTAPLGSGLHQEPFHFYGGFTPYWYRRFLEAAGFGRISIEPNGGFFKHYGQESIRFARMSYPPKTGLGVFGQAVLFPLWILLVPFFAMVLPWLCHLLDQTEKERKFTVGYRVVAVKEKNIGQSSA